MYEEIYASPIGKIKICAEDEYITKINFYKTSKIEEFIKNTEAPITPKQVEINAVNNCKKQLEEYFKQKRKSFDIKYKLKGTEFQCRVWEELTKIPYGETVTYKDIAIRIGKETAVRAVANMIGKNCIGIVVPCHRVIGTNGKLTGFSAKTDEKTGLELKQELLNLEGNHNWRI